MDKDFEKWNENKKVLDNLNTKLFFKNGEVWWCSIGLNIAMESNGKGNFFMRPVLIIKKLTKQSFIGIPLSTKIKHGNWFYPIKIGDRRSILLLNQLRMFSTNRLQRRLSSIDEGELGLIKQKLKRLLEL